MAGGRRTTVGWAASKASCHGWPGPVEPTGPGAGEGGTRGSARTMVPGEAVPRKKEPGPAQRQAAQSARSTAAGGGPQPSHDLRGNSWRPSATASSTTQPRTLRPCRGTRTRVPTTTG